MKKLALIFFAIFLSAPLSAVLFVGADHLLTEPVEVLGYNYNPPIWVTILVVALYEIPIYIFLGIPVTYLIDFLILKFSPHSHRLKQYLYQLIGYSIAALILSGYLIHDDYDFTLFIPVLTYFHILWFLRGRFGD
ncbi:hypothetical protein [Rossellomorea sp. DUT-2]|uniref:hypothetical protein n=1 Tax=Rossellomorea sp. DUT-2 TaxID=3412021 RepID=UPI003D17B14B